MGKDKKLEETADLDAKEIRKQTSKNVNQKSSVSKKETSKSSTKKKKTSAKPSKKPTKKTSAKPRSASSPNQTVKSGSSEKIRRFPKEEKQNPTSKKSSAKKKKTFRKIKGILIFTLACIVILGGVLLFAVSQLFKVKTITINYDLNKTSQSENVKRKYTDEQIINASGIHIGDNLVYLKYIKDEKITQTICSNLSYLSVKSIDSKGMNTLILNVRQIRVAYAFMFDSTYVLTDELMNVIDVTQDKEAVKKYTIVRYANVLSFEKGQKITFAEHQGDGIDLDTLFEAIKISGLKNISYISVKDMNDLYMTYDNRIQIHIGTTDNIVEKLKLTAKSLAEEDKNSPSQKGKLNMTIDKKAYFTQE